MSHIGTKRVVKAFFSPGQHPHYLEITVVKNNTALKELLLGDALLEDSNDIQAFCAFRHGHKGPDMGSLIFDRNHLDYGVVTHECTHAALSFVNELSMTSEAVAAMGEDEQYEYFQEATARVVESLFRQVEAQLSDWFNMKPKKESAMTDTLFDIPEQKSPRLLWMEKHGIEIIHRPEFDGEEEDELTGATLYPYMAIACGEKVGPPGFGMAEDCAITDWARKNNVRLWNEE